MLKKIRTFLNCTLILSIIIWIALLQGVVMSVFSDLFVNILI